MSADYDKCIVSFSVVLSIGDTDIDSTYFDETGYMTLFKRILDKFNEAGVKRRVIRNILPRKVSNITSTESYNQRRDLINNRLHIRISAVDYD